MCATGLVGLYQRQKALQIQARLLQDVRQGGTFDGAMGRDRDFEEFVAEAFLEAQVAARWRTIAQPSLCKARTICV